MRVLLSSNPYRDRGLRAALEARKILERAGVETALCLPFVPKKGDRLELPRHAQLKNMEEELPKADPSHLLWRGRDHSPRCPGCHPA